VRFYLKIKVPELPDDIPASGITIILQAVGEEAESNVEHIDILISRDEVPAESDLTETASTVGTVSGVSVLALLLKRRFI
jgi:hypothetical protein